MEWQTFKPKQLLIEEFLNLSPFRQFHEDILDADMLVIILKFIIRKWDAASIEFSNMDVRLCLKFRVTHTRLGEHDPEEADVVRATLQHLQTL